MALSAACAEEAEPSSSIQACRVDADCGGEMLCIEGLCTDSESGAAGKGDDVDEDGDESTSAASSASATAPDGGADETSAGGDEPACGDPSCEGNAIRVCENGSEVVYDCNTVCSQDGFGPAAGCGFSSESGYDVCFCEEAEDVCAEAGQSCGANGDCCDFGASSAGCVGFDTGSACADMCELNSGCASDCCMPLTTNGAPAGYGACVPASLCSPSACGYSWCDFDWCGSAFYDDCPEDWFGDGDCDCGCQFADIDCS
jgi:hypothetical protein